MKTNTFGIFSILVTSFIFLSISACHRHGEHHSFGRIDHKKLDLSLEQKAQLDKVMSTLQSHKNKLGDHGQLRSVFIDQFNSNHFASLGTTEWFEIAELRPTRRTKLQK